MSARAAAVLMLSISLFAFLLIVASVAPSVYAQNSYPGDRALLPAVYVEVAALMLLGWLFGEMVIRHLSVSWKAPLLVALFILALYPLRASISITHSIGRYQIWQTLWDMRYRQILEARQKGNMDLEVFKIDLNPAYDLDDISDIGPKPNTHYNMCAAEYLGLNSITADIYPP